MPIVKKIEPVDADILTARIFACNPDKESEVVIGAVREHIEIWGSKALLYSNPTGKREIPLDNEQCVIYLIQGSFELGAELIDVDKRVVRKEGLAYVVEGEEVVRLRGQTAVVVLWVRWEDEGELGGLGPDVEVLGRGDRGDFQF